VVKHPRFNEKEKVTQHASGAKAAIGFFANVAKLHFCGEVECRMARLNRRDLTVRISNETGIIQEKVSLVIELMLKLLTESLLQGQTVELRNFGVFELKTRRATVGRNPRKPENAVLIPSRVRVRFRPGKILKQRVKAKAQNGVI
jgi:nucleoid DNA-binding protein